jgi:hypothetical protein
VRARSTLEHPRLRFSSLLDLLDGVGTGRPGSDYVRVFGQEVLVGQSPPAGPRGHAAFHAARAFHPARAVAAAHPARAIAGRRA